jgi:hypothetical protein
MANTYVAISTVTVGSGGSAFMSFSSIPQTYTDLLIKASIRSDGGGDYADQIRMKVNGVSATDSSFTQKVLRDAAGTVDSYNQSVNQLGYAVGPTATASVFGSLDVYIPNYTVSQYKSISNDTVTENNSTSVMLTLSANLWSNNAAITSLDIYVISGNCVQHSTATLYGIKNS